jgi:hypothetical protein
MFLLLMPVFAAPLEAFAAFGQLLHSHPKVKADNQYSCQRVYQCTISQPGLGSIRVIARPTAEAG